MSSTELATFCGLPEDAVVVDDKKWKKLLMTPSLCVPNGGLCYVSANGVIHMIDCRNMIRSAAGGGTSSAARRTKRLTD
jgi:hypothetical protein